MWLKAIKDYCSAIVFSYSLKRKMTSLDILKSMGYYYTIKYKWLNNRAQRGEHESGLTRLRNCL